MEQLAKEVAGLKIDAVLYLDRLDVMATDDMDEQVTRRGWQHAHCLQLQLAFPGSHPRGAWIAGLFFGGDAGGACLGCGGARVGTRACANPLLLIARLAALPFSSIAQVIDQLTVHFGAALWDHAILGLTRATEAAAPQGTPFDAWVEHRSAELQALIAKVGREGVRGDLRRQCRLACAVVWLQRASGLGEGRHIQGCWNSPRSRVLTLRHARRHAPCQARRDYGPSLPKGTSPPPLPVALLENHSFCPQNAAGEKLVPGERPWLTELFETVAGVISANPTPYVHDAVAAGRAANPDRRYKWLIPLVLVGQFGLKLLLDRLLEHDRRTGNEDGPYPKDRLRLDKRIGRVGRVSGRGVCRSLVPGQARAALTPRHTPDQREARSVHVGATHPPGTVTGTGMLSLSRRTVLQGPCKQRCTP